MNRKFILCLALVLSVFVYYKSHYLAPAAVLVPEETFRVVTYDWRPQIYSRVWTNGDWLYSYVRSNGTNDYYGELAMKLKQSKVPTEEKAVNLAEGTGRNTGRLYLDDFSRSQVTALLTLNDADAELGNKGDFVWEVRIIHADESIVGLIWVDAFTGKVRFLYPPETKKMH